MPATKSDLDLELESLRLDVANLNVLRKLTRAQEWRVMGDVFVWWQRAREVVGYLEQCYAANDIANEVPHLLTRAYSPSAVLEVTTLDAMTTTKKR